MADMWKKFVDFIGLGDEEDDLEDEEYYEEEQPPVRRTPKSGLSNRERDRFHEDEEFVPAPAPKSTAPVQNSARRTQQGQRVQASAGVAMPGPNGMKMIVYHPVSYEDTQNIIDNIRNRKPVIVNMEELEIDVAQRILDFISGAVYALDGTMNKISRGIFVVAPANCDVIGSSEEEYEEI